MTSTMVQSCSSLPTKSPPFATLPPKAFAPSPTTVKTPASSPSPLKTPSPAANAPSPHLRHFSSPRDRFSCSLSRWCPYFNYRLSSCSPLSCQRCCFE
ncbi:hypothetical protein OIU84_005838 [Salix udensis]|uniref:Uncharacterized protein n=1 Tax=Salix udensis TaxID=889485 RepID=A0AAD6JX46_9ROSI|nr:hypothetical protein OIU84_005838 [Salix udensis]